MVKFNFEKNWWIIALVIVAVIFIVKGKGFMGAAYEEIVLDQSLELCEQTGGAYYEENPGDVVDDHNITERYSYCECPSDLRYDFMEGCREELWFEMEGYGKFGMPCSTSLDCPTYGEVCTNLNNQHSEGHLPCVGGKCFYIGSEGECSTIWIDRGDKLLQGPCGVWWDCSQPLDHNMMANCIGGICTDIIRTVCTSDEDCEWGHCNPSNAAVILDGEDKILGIDSESRGCVSECEPGEIFYMTDFFDLGCHKGFAEDLYPYAECVNGEFVPMGTYMGENEFLEIVEGGCYCIDDSQCAKGFECIGQDCIRKTPYAAYALIAIVVVLGIGAYVLFKKKK